MGCCASGGEKAQQEDREDGGDGRPRESVEKIPRQRSSSLSEGTGVPRKNSTSRGRSGRRSNPLAPSPMPHQDSRMVNVGSVSDLHLSDRADSGIPLRISSTVTDTPEETPTPTNPPPVNALAPQPGTLIAATPLTEVNPLSPGARREGDEAAPPEGPESASPAARHSLLADSLGLTRTTASEPPTPATTATLRRRDEEDRPYDERRKRLNRWFDRLPPVAIPVAQGMVRHGEDKPKLTAENVDRNRAVLESMARQRYSEAESREAAAAAEAQAQRKLEAGSPASPSPPEAVQGRPTEAAQSEGPAPQPEASGAPPAPEARAEDDA
eukprot:TRINITY_DN23194_c0_g1_i1.p1 TRINITY_DN23194_c0_g1~~TRINITY_DN23194_c0_g1_i1.p1  ORF type:complete len:326 (+),score=70.07 TRINITY_DN23194_c0_g1_i1:127-1104(+)